MILNSIVESLSMEPRKDGYGFPNDFVTFLIHVMLITTIRVVFSRLELHNQPVQNPDTAVHVLMLWTPRVPRENLKPCNAAAFCNCMAAIVRKYGSSAWDRLREFYLSQYVQAVDERSAETIRHVLDLSYQWFFHGKRVSQLPPQRVVEEEQAFSVEMKKWQVQFPGLPYYLSENFYHHHGLRFVAPETVHQYLSTRDFLDFGASIGDSLVVLKSYTTGRVISYELIPNTFHRALK
jgi:hypothetical protein